MYLHMYLNCHLSAVQLQIKHAVTQAEIQQLKRKVRFKTCSRKMI